MEVKENKREKDKGWKEWKEWKVKIEERREKQRWNGTDRKDRMQFPANGHL